MRVHYSHDTDKPRNLRSYASYAIEGVETIEFNETDVWVYTSAFPFKLLLAEFQSRGDKAGWYVLDMTGDRVGPVLLRFTEGER